MARCARPFRSDIWSATRSIRRVHRESRSGFKHRSRRATSFPNLPRPLSRHDRVAVAWTMDTVAFSGPGVRCLDPVYIFYRHRRWPDARGHSDRTFGAPPEAFVAFIENHDQVSNTAAGERLRFQTSPGRYRAMTALLLLGPWTPLLFQGQEFGASTPFTFFTDTGDGPMREAIQIGHLERHQKHSSRSSRITIRFQTPQQASDFVSKPPQAAIAP